MNDESQANRKSMIPRIRNLEKTLHDLDDTCRKIHIREKGCQNMDSLNENERRIFFEGWKEKIDVLYKPYFDGIKRSEERGTL